MKDCTLNENSDTSALLPRLKLTPEGNGLKSDSSSLDPSRYILAGSLYVPRDFLNKDKKILEELLVGLSKEVGEDSLEVGKLAKDLLDLEPQLGPRLLHTVLATSLLHISHLASSFLTVGEKENGETEVENMTCAGILRELVKYEAKVGSTVVKKILVTAFQQLKDIREELDACSFQMNRVRELPEDQQQAQSAEKYNNLKNSEYLCSLPLTMNRIKEVPEDHHQAQSAEKYNNLKNSEHLCSLPLTDKFPKQTEGKASSENLTFLDHASSELWTQVFNFSSLIPTGKPNEVKKDHLSSPTRNTVCQNCPAFTSATFYNERLSFSVEIPVDCLDGAQLLEGCYDLIFTTEKVSLVPRVKETIAFSVVHCGFLQLFSLKYLIQVPTARKTQVQSLVASKNRPTSGSVMISVVAFRAQIPEKENKLVSKEDEQPLELNCSRNPNKNKNNKPILVKIPDDVLKQVSEKEEMGQGSVGLLHVSVPVSVHQIKGNGTAVSVLGDTAAWFQETKSKQRIRNQVTSQEEFAKFASVDELWVEEKKFPLKLRLTMGTNHNRYTLSVNR